MLMPRTISLLLCVLLQNSAGEEYSAMSVSSHIDTLLAEYDREVPPAERVLVTLVLDVRHAALDDSAATMRMLADLKMSWSDPRLTWNSSTFEDSSVLVSVDRLWRPDVEAAGAAAVGAGGAGGFDSYRARLNEDGSVAAIARLDLTVPLALHLDRWPQDEHTAVYKFASREYSQDELDLAINVLKNAVVVECGAWEVVSVKGEVVSVARGATWRVAQWAVRVSRRGGALRVAATGALLAAALLTAAAVSRPYAHRAPLAAAAAILTAVWLIAATFHMPAAREAPRAVVAAGWMCGVAASAALGAALAARTARRTAPPSAALRALLSRVSALYSLTPHTECVEAEGAGGAWAAAARLLDAALAAQLLLALLAITIYYFC